MVQVWVGLQRDAVGLARALCILAVCTASVEFLWCSFEGSGSNRWRLACMRHCFWRWDYSRAASRCSRVCWRWCSGLWPWGCSRVVNQLFNLSDELAHNPPYWEGARREGVGMWGYYSADLFAVCELFQCLELRFNLIHKDIPVPAVQLHQKFFWYIVSKVRLGRQRVTYG